MKIRKKVIALVLCVIMALCAVGTLSACGDNGEKQPVVEPPAPVYEVHSVTLQYNDANVTGGTLSADVSAGTIQLGAKVEKDEQADGTVTYESSNASVATINSSGLVTLVAKGETVISATAGDKSHKIVLVVGDDYSQSSPYTITVNGGTSSVTSARPGDYVTLSATVPEHKDFTEWSYSVEGVWTNGNVFRMPESDITITANFDDMLYTLNVVGAKVSQAGETADPAGEDGGNTEGGELPEYDITTYKFTYETAISLEAIEEPEGKMFVGWDYNTQNNRVGGPESMEYGPFDMPDSTLTVWAVYSPLQTKVLTGANGVPWSGQAINNGMGDPALEGLSGFRFSIPGNGAAVEAGDYSNENICGSDFNTTQNGTQTMKAILRNTHESLSVTVELYLTYYDNLVTSGNITIGPGQTVTHYFTAGIGIYNPWWGIVLREDVGGSSSDTVTLDLVMGGAPMYPSGDKLLSVSGNAEYVNLERNGTSVNPVDYGVGWPRDKVLNNDVGLLSLAVYDGNFGTDPGRIPGYLTAKITNMPAYDPENPTTTIYVRFIYNTNNEDPFGTYDFAVTNNEFPINLDGEIAAIDQHHVEVTQTGQTEVFKLDIPRSEDDGGVFYFNIIKMQMDNGDNLKGHNFSVQMTYNNVMGYTEEA